MEPPGLRRHGTLAYLGWNQRLCSWASISASSYNEDPFRPNHSWRNLFCTMQSTNVDSPLRLCHLSPSKMKYFGRALLSVFSRMPLRSTNGLAQVYREVPSLPEPLVGAILLHWTVRCCLVPGLSSDGGGLESFEGESSRCTVYKTLSAV
jgi:hypothetical protein